MKQECIDSHLILLRGNSGSGKTTVAKMLQRKLGRGTLYIPQDVIRRELLWVKDEPDNKAIPLLENLLEYGKTNCEYTILEGILRSEIYKDLFSRAHEIFGTHIYAYYFDLPFEETLARHMTKPNCDEFGEKEMREWYVEHDLLDMFPERIIKKEQSVEEIVEMIWKDIDY